MAIIPAAATAPAPKYSEGFFSSPTDLSNAAIQTNLAVSNIDAAIAAAGTSSTAPANWVDSWDAFKLVWTSFFTQNFAKGDIASWLTSDLEDSLEGYQQQVSSFAAQAASYGITVPGGVPSVPSGDPLSWLPTGGTVLGALALTALIVIVWKVA